MTKYTPIDQITNNGDVCVLSLVRMVLSISVYLEECLWECISADDENVINPMKMAMKYTTQRWM